MPRIKVYCKFCDGIAEAEKVPGFPVDRVICRLDLLYLETDCIELVPQKNLKALEILTERNPFHTLKVH
jgi:hypothetical protein